MIENVFFSDYRFELDSEKSYFTVTWYKDNEHIYSFLKKQMKKQIFPMEGVDIDVSIINFNCKRIQNFNSVYLEQSY